MARVTNWRLARSPGAIRATVDGRAIDYLPVAASYKTSKEFSIGLTELSTAVNDFAAELKGHGRRLVVIYAPSKEETYADKLKAAGVPPMGVFQFNDQIGEFCRRNGNRVSGPSSAFETEGRSGTPLYLMHDGHWTSRWNQVAADNIYRYLSSVPQLGQIAWLHRSSRPQRRCAHRRPGRARVFKVSELSHTVQLAQAHARPMLFILINKNDAGSLQGLLDPRQGLSGAGYFVNGSLNPSNGGNANRSAFGNLTLLGADEMCRCNSCSAARTHCACHNDLRGLLPTCCGWPCLIWPASSDEARGDAVLAGLPGEIKGIDGDAVSYRDRRDKRA